MKDKDSVKLLQRLGFGDYEARAYLDLLRSVKIAGYAQHFTARR